MERETHYVVVINRSGTIPLRHIVTIYNDYDSEEFQKWYYGQYFKFSDDEFIYCPTKSDLDNWLKEYELKQSGRK